MEIIQFSIGSSIWLCWGHFWSYTNSLAMVVDISLLLIPQGFNVSLKQDINKRLEQVEQQPYVNHLHIGSLREVVTHIDEHRRQDQHHRNIQRDYSLYFRILLKSCKVIFGEFSYRVSQIMHLRLLFSHYAASRAFGN